MAFSSPAGHWEFTSLPFGLKTAPSCFKKIINTVLTGLLSNKVQVYLDDIIILGDIFSNHADNLEQILDRLKEAKLTLKMEKCNFLRTK